MATGLGAASGLALAAAVSLEHRTSDLSTLAGALLAYALALVVFRRLAGGVGLAVLGVVVSATAAWLIPQRPDAVSAVLLSALFGIGAGLTVPARRPLARSDQPRRWLRLAITLGAGLAGLVAVVALWVLGARTVLLAVAVVLVLGAAAGAAPGAARVRTAAAPAQGRARRPLSAWVVGSAVTVGTVAFVAYLGASTATIGWFGGGVRHGNRQQRDVALTFDDGPNDSASLALAGILDRYHTKGTFFLVGKAIDARPRVVQELYRDGQLVGNHSYHHDQWRWLDPGYPELDRTDDAFRRHLGVCPALYRPPHGQRTPLLRGVVDAHHMRMVMWDVSTSDWTTTDAGAVARRIVAQARPGSIIDLHDGLDGDPTVDRTVVVRALPIILDGLRHKHLRPVRLDQLIGGPAYLRCDGGQAAARPLRDRDTDRDMSPIILVTTTAATAGTASWTARERSRSTRHQARGITAKSMAASTSLVRDRNTGTGTNTSLRTR